MKPQHQLDKASQERIDNFISTPQRNKSLVTQLYFDVAIGFSKVTEYRIICFRFDSRKMIFFRHGVNREEYLFTSISMVQTADSGKLKVIISDMGGNLTNLSIIPQSHSDYLAIFQLLKELSTNSSKNFYSEDFSQDYVNKKKCVDCKKKGKTYWARREMVIYNGLFVLYETENSILPLTILPFCDKVTISIRPRNIMEITCLIRKILLHFDTEQIMNEVYTTFLTCKQYQRTPIHISVKSFKTGRLADLQPACRETCMKNNLYPDECVDHFPILCEVLRAVTKKRCVTLGDRKGRREEDEIPRRQQPTQLPPQPEDELYQYCQKNNPHEMFTKWEPLGKGGFGEVFKVQSKYNDKQFIALKVLKHSVDERYAKIGCEVARLKLWDHPNVIKLTGCWIYESKIFIGMELCSNGNLKNHIKPRSLIGFPINDIAYILNSSLKGLAYIHNTGFIHRDIKSANILLDDFFGVKLIDFGLVVRKASHPQNRAGSKSYMAPEVIKQIPYDEKVDIWSIGCVAQELQETQPPYKEHGVFKGMFKTAAIGAQGLRDPNKVPQDFLEFVNRCFEYEPRRRPSCEELLNHRFLKRETESKYYRMNYNSH
ncbi:Serine/threonine-protein kinase [Entamoeba marina]